MVNFKVDDVPDLAGRIFFVTGGNTGLGKESIHAFARRGAKVYMAARTESKALAAIESIKSELPDAQIYHIPLDLTSFESIKSAVDIFTAREESLHVLLNNAGIMNVPYSTTKEGYEVQFGTNHMGHFLLTKLLLPTLERTAKTAPEGSVRIVNVASMAHMIASTRGGIPFDNLQNEKSLGMTRYGISKLANILHARALSKRYSNAGVTTVSLHPGVIATDLYAPMASGNFMNKLSHVVFQKFSKSVQDGALNQIYLSTSPHITKADSGDFFIPVGIKNGYFYWGASKYAKDDQMAEKLWEWSEKEIKKHGY